MGRRRRRWCWSTRPTASEGPYRFSPKKGTARLASLRKASRRWPRRRRMTYPVMKRRQRSRTLGPPVGERGVVDLVDPAPEDQLPARQALDLQTLAHHPQGTQPALDHHLLVAEAEEPPVVFQQAPVPAHHRRPREVEHHLLGQFQPTHQPLPGTRWTLTGPAARAFVPTAHTLPPAGMGDNLALGAYAGRAVPRTASPRSLRRDRKTRDHPGSHPSLTASAGAASAEPPRPSFYGGRSACRKTPSDACPARPRTAARFGESA